MKIRPSLVCLFELTEGDALSRLSNRRVDPTTGTYYNLEADPPSDEATGGRLIELVEDKEHIVK